MKSKRKNKHTQNILVSVIIFLVFVSFFCVSSYAEDAAEDSAETPVLENYATEYFHHLKENIGENSEKSCGYVAAGMLLSYYDSYWHDDFIHEDYDERGEVNSVNFEIKKSPGIKNDDNSYTDYDDFIDENADEYFHLRLLQIGRDDLGLCDDDEKNRSSSDPKDKSSNTKWGITIYEIKAIIERYLSQLPGTIPNSTIITNNVSVHVSSSLDDSHKHLNNPNAEIRKELIAKIKAGIPVIYFGHSSTRKAGHFMVAYDYDESQDKIYFHTGWISPNHMNDKDLDNFVFTENTSILWLEIDETELHHKCSDNYANLDTDEKFCACQVYERHPKHEDTHNTDNFYGKHLDDGAKSWSECYGCGEIINLHYHDYVTTYTETHHRTVCEGCGYDVVSEHNISEESNSVKVWEECDCGYYKILHFHDLSYAYRSASQHREECNSCYYLSISQHQFILQSINFEQHQEKCACGYTRGEAVEHSSSGYEYKSKLLHNITCECGFVMGTAPHSIVSDGPLKSHCTDCGAVFNTGSDIIIKKKENELYTE